MSGPPCVLDASALLAYLYEEEPGAERVVAVLDGSALVSAVNWCEVLSKLEDRGWPTHADFMSRFRGLRAALEVVAFNEIEARMAASFRRSTRRAKLSLADRSCLATGRVHDLPVVTADRAWADLGLGVDVQLIR
jgi:ribonuclease VapC